MRKLSIPDRPSVTHQSIIVWTLKIRSPLLLFTKWSPAFLFSAIGDALFVNFKNLLFIDRLINNGVDTFVSQYLLASFLVLIKLRIPVAI